MQNSADSSRKPAPVKVPAGSSAHRQPLYFYLTGIMYASAIITPAAFLQTFVLLDSALYINGRIDWSLFLIPLGAILVTGLLIGHILQLSYRLKQNSEKFRAVADIAKEFIYLRTIDGHYEYVSSSCTDLCGYMQEDFYATPNFLDTLIHPDDLDRWKNHVRSVNNCIAFEYFDVRLITKNNRIVWISHNCIPVFDESGQQIAVRSSNVNITERKKAEQDLRKSALYLDTMSDALLVATPDTSCIKVNTDTLKLWGYSSEELIGMSVLELFTEEEVPKHKVEIEKAIKTGIITQFETIALTKNGKRIPIELRGKVIKDDQGTVSELIAVIRDITERKKAEEELINHREHLEELVEESTNDLKISNRYLNEAVKELETFSYSISHDLKAPLRAISGFSGMLSQDYSSCLDKEGNRLLNVINVNAVQMGQLIDDILMYSRTVRKPLERGEINIKKLAEGVISELKGEYKGRDIAFDVHEMPKCTGDSVLIKQVLMNLISNAIKFTVKEEKAEIEVGSRQTDNETIYHIKDNGVGFDTKYADKLFGLFQRLHSTKEFEGTGVGLSITQRIIHKHRGKIWAEAKVNEGATFYFSL